MISLIFSEHVSEYRYHISITSIALPVYSTDLIKINLLWTRGHIAIDPSAPCILYIHVFWACDHVIN